MDSNRNHPQHFQKRIILNIKLISMNLRAILCISIDPQGFSYRTVDDNIISNGYIPSHVLFLNPEPTPSNTL